MKQARVLKKYFFVALGLAVFSSFALQADAQTPQPTDSKNQSTTATRNEQTKAPEDVADADILIIANVTARELKFEAVPNPTVEFPGTKERKTVWEADRQNLPRPVEPGVTYRNIGIQLRISSRFADIERIVAEALGEIPPSEDKLTTQPKTENQPPAASVQPAAPSAKKTAAPATPPRSN